MVQDQGIDTERNTQDSEDPKQQDQQHSEKFSFDHEGLVDGDSVARMMSLAGEITDHGK